MALGQLGHALGLEQGQERWFFDKDVKAVGDRMVNDVVEQMGFHHHIHGIRLGLGQHRAVITEAVFDAVFVGGGVEPGFVEIADAHDVHVVHRR